jgi:predicted phosphodiesterase
MTKANVARAYRKLHPDKPTLALARLMYNDKNNNQLFKDLEDARTSLRYIEGKFGEKNKFKTVRNSEFYKEGERPKNPYKLPESDAESFEPFHIKGKKGLILNDIHLPYHDIAALTAALDFGKKEKPDFIFLNGDVLDFHQLSYFQKDPRKKRFSEELDMFGEFISTLHKLFKCKIYYKFGNHEERYDSFLFQKAGELVGVEEFSLEEIIKKRADVTVIRDKRLVVMNGLPFIHGHEFGRGVFSPVNAARGLFLQAKHSCVKGDCHTSSEHTDPDIFGKLITTWSVGCLCGLTPKWLPLNKWNHGFAIIELDGTKSYKMRNFRVDKGKVY